MSLVPRQKVTVKVKNTGGMLSSVPGGQTSTSVKSTQLVSADGGGPKRLDTLSDVQETSPETGDTLVYDATSDRYVVKTMNVDGGTF